VNATVSASKVLVNMATADEMLDVLDAAEVCRRPNATTVTITMDAVMTPNTYKVEIRRAGTGATETADITWSCKGK